MKKDVSIQIVRICAMFSILACHLVQELNNSKIAQLAQFFNVGVYIFLFLSSNNDSNIYFLYFSFYNTYNRWNYGI